MVAVGYPHHITQRGNYRQDIFHDDVDRERYLSLLHNESRKYDLKILAYCLMTNHVHFIAVPQKENSLGNVFKYSNMKYSQYLNKKIGITGHLFQGRFFSTVMDKYHTLVCARYVERNPVRAKMVEEPNDYEWSSAQVHSDKKKSDILGVNELFNYIEHDKIDWQNCINQSDNPADICRIHTQTRKGRPLGNDNFIKQLERKLNRNLFVLSAGRPRKTKK